MRNAIVVLITLAMFVLASCKDTLPPVDANSHSTSLVAWYKFDQNTADSSGNNHHGTQQGGTFVPDRFGGAQSALSLDGTSFVSVLDASDLDFDSLASFSVSAWIKTKDTSSNYRGIISKGPVSGQLPGYSIGMEKSGKILVAVSGDRNPTMRSTSSINNGGWHLITLIVQANTLAALFIDGSLESSFPLTTFYPDRNNSAYLFIGKDRTSSNFFTGSVDDLRIYSKSLTPLEVLDLYSAGGWIGDTTSAPVDTTTTGGGTFAANTLDNSSFHTTYTSQGSIDNSTFPPWQVAYGTPRFGAGDGADSIPGYAYLWGTLDDGNAIWQPLSTPIVKGHTYKVTAYITMKAADLHDTRYVNVRFVAFNQMPFGNHWQAVAGQVAPIGSVTVTKLDDWQQYQTLEWTADADYSNFEIDAATLASGANNVSWASIDLVELHEKK